MVFLSHKNIFNILTMIQSKANTETRGRPRKQQTRILSPIYKTIFSDNSAIIHTSFLIYVFQVFVETKNEKRVGHKDGGFTIYDKIDNEYCFDNIQEELISWDCNSLAANQKMRDFVRLLPALGPKVILKEICTLINYIVSCQAQGLSEQLVLNQLTHPNNEQRLNQMYPYMRFVPLALHQLKLDRNERLDRSNSLHDLVKQRVNYLWEHLQKIIIHTIFNCIYGNVHNKYFKPFFSDAQNPNQTHIGQLNLDQIVKAVRKQENNQKSNRGSEHNLQQENIDKIRKMRSVVDSDGTRTVVHVIKAPQLNNIQRISSQNTGVAFGGVSTKVQKSVASSLNENIFSKGFTPLQKPKSQNQNEQRTKKQVTEINAGGFKSSLWKPSIKQQHKLFSSPIRASQLKIELNNQVKKQQHLKVQSQSDGLKQQEEPQQEMYFQKGSQCKQEEEKQ